MTHKVLITCLNIAGGCIGIAASFFWFLAAAANPQPSEPGAAFFDVPSSPNTPCAKAWRQATRFNKIAAVLTGVSVLVLSISTILEALSSLHNG